MSAISRQKFVRRSEIIIVDNERMKNDDASKKISWRKHEASA